MTLVNRRVLEDLALLLTAAFAFFWAILRARVQSITLDEADTFFWFVSKTPGYIWYPWPNNHVLNSLLMWMTTHVFGNSILAVRLPALLGAFLHIGICYFLCRSLTDRFILQLPILICLTYNPFIADYMVAARGYGLADAFLLAAIAIPVWHSMNGHASLRASCILASIALGLSFTANFTFAFVDTAAFLALAIWAFTRAARTGESARNALMCCVLPGLTVALLLCGYPLMHWKKGELIVGSHSLEEMTQSLVQSSLCQVWPALRGTDFYDFTQLLKPVLLPLAGILCGLQVVVTRLDGSWLQDVNTRLLGRFAAALTGIATLSVLMSWLAFHFDGLPLPLGRTGIYLVPLGTLLLATIAAAPARSLVSRWLRRGITGVLICMACYFLLCLRLTYFREYDYGADSKDVYSVLARLNHTYGVADVVTGGLYASSLNYYRVLSGKETFPEFTQAEGHALPAGKSIYVVHGSYEREFIEKEKLAIVYRGKSTDVVIAVRPEGAIPPTPIVP